MNTKDKYKNNPTTAFKEEMRRDEINFEMNSSNSILDQLDPFQRIIQTS